MTGCIVVCYNIGYPFETHLKLKSFKTSFAHNYFPTYLIPSKFCTKHYSDNGMICANFHNDCITEIDAMDPQIFASCVFKMSFGCIFHIAIIPCSLLYLICSWLCYRVPYNHCNLGYHFKTLAKICLLITYFLFCPEHSSHTGVLYMECQNSWMPFEIDGSEEWDFVSFEFKMSVLGTVQCCYNVVNIIWCCKPKAEFELTKYIPYITLMGELWGVFHDVLEKIDHIITALHCISMA